MYPGTQVPTQVPRVTGLRRSLPRHGILTDIPPAIVTGIITGIIVVVVVVLRLHAVSLDDSPRVIGAARFCPAVVVLVPRPLRLPHHARIAPPAALHICLVCAGGSLIKCPSRPHPIQSLPSQVQSNHGPFVRPAAPIIHALRPHNHNQSLHSRACPSAIAYPPPWS